jgi:osmotically-inducible protein OsmY
MFMSSLPPPTVPRQLSAWMVWLCCLALMGVLVFAGSLRADDLDKYDLQHEVNAHRALTEDPVLAKLHLLVKVRKRVATVTGTVPSRELAQHAVDCLNKVPDIIEVRNAIRVEGEAMVLPKKPPTVFTGQKKEDSGLRGAWLPLPANGSEPTTKSVALSPPSSSADLPTSVKKTPAKADAAAVVSAVKNLIVADERFRGIRFEVKDNKVYLTGVVYGWPDLHELSRAITRVPGVEAVVLQEIRAEPKK